MPIPNYLYGKELTPEQKDIIKAIEQYNVILVDAKAGSGKTWIATAIAKMLKKPMHYIFAPVLHDVLGALPGNLQEKEEPFLVGLKDALYALGELPEQAIFRVATKDEPEEEEQPKQKKQQKGKIVNPKYKEPTSGEPWVFPSSHIYWRGGNIENSVVVIDEAQNFTKHELKKILTRCHDSCLIFVIGHAQQCDLKKPELSGFVPYIEHSKNTDLATICTLTKNFRGRISKWADSIE